jgi:hypothetical protein
MIANVLIHRSGSLPGGLPRAGVTSATGNDHLYTNHLSSVNRLNPIGAFTDRAQTFFELITR